MSSKNFTAKKWNGDDRYSWAVFYKKELKERGQDFARPIVCGLSRSEATYYIKKFDREVEEGKRQGIKSCGCRNPMRHRDCAYCGLGGPCTHICGECKEAGIDGRVIRGTERRTCSDHK